MYEGSWMIKECDRVAAGMLARELEVSGTTAAVLVRRSYDDVARARAFLAGELPAHDPFELGDMAAACETIRGAIAADRKSTRLNSSHTVISYAVFCLKKNKP